MTHVIHRVCTLHLHQSVVSELGAGQRRRRSEETGVRHFLHSLPDRQHERRVHERHDDVGVELVCK